MCGCAADMPDVIDRFKGTFESLWDDSGLQQTALCGHDAVARTHTLRLSDFRRNRVWKEIPIASLTLQTHTARPRRRAQSRDVNFI